MSQKRTYRKHDETFKKDAVNLVLEEGYSVAQAAKSLEISTGLLYNLKDSGHIVLKMLLLVVHQRHHLII